LLQFSAHFRCLLDNPARVEDSKNVRIGWTGLIGQSSKPSRTNDADAGMLACIEVSTSLIATGQSEGHESLKQRGNDKQRKKNGEHIVTIDSVTSFHPVYTPNLAESNGSLLPGLWRDSLHVTCGLTACIPGSAPGPTLGNEYGKTLLYTPISLFVASKPCGISLRLPIKRR